MINYSLFMHNHWLTITINHEYSWLSKTQWFAMIIQMHFHDNSWIIVNFHVINHVINHKIVSMEPVFQWVSSHSHWLKYQRHSTNIIYFFIYVNHSWESMISNKSNICQKSLLIVPRPWERNPSENVIFDVFALEWRFYAFNMSEILS